MNLRLPAFLFVMMFLASGSIFVKGQLFADNSEQNTAKKTKNVIYFNPEIFPEVEEIRGITNESFYAAVTDRFSQLRNSRILRVETPVSYQNVDVDTVKEIIINNNADYAIIPKVKFFKVGIGNYVFSSQVVVSMKLYSAEGKIISETSYDTFRKNARIFGSAENSIKIGTEGALKNIIKDLRKQKKH